VAEREQYDAYGGTSGSSLTRYLYTGRELDSSTGLYFYRARYYSSLTGRFLSEDPSNPGTGESNLYAYAMGDPVAAGDPTGLQGNPQYCARLLEKIANVRQKIQQRLGELDEDPESLPESCSGDDLKPSLSRRGHRKLINMDKALLAALEAYYAAYCQNQNPPPAPVTPLVPVPGPAPAPVPAPVPTPTPTPQSQPDTPSRPGIFNLKYWEAITGLTGTALIAYLVLSEGSRLFPPRNLVPVP
jgi:RHS repeat-associated protein